MLYNAHDLPCIAFSGNQPSLSIMYLKHEKTVASGSRRVLELGAGLELGHEDRSLIV